MYINTRAGLIRLQSTAIKITTWREPSGRARNLTGRWEICMKRNQERLSLSLPKGRFCTNLFMHPLPTAVDRSQRLPRRRARSAAVPRDYKIDSHRPPRRPPSTLAVHEVGQSGRARPTSRAPTGARRAGTPGRTTRYGVERQACCSISLIN